jgi:type VI secretion system protein ImpE
MSAEEFLRRGDLDRALSTTQDLVRQDPGSARLRTCLFQLLAVRGQWERAMKQLDVVGDLDPQTIAMVQTYRPALQCELLRAEVFAGTRTPLVLGGPEPWMAYLLSALQLTAEGAFGQADEVRCQAFEAAPTTAGTVDGEPFEWIADADSRFGPMLEAIINGRYHWVPFHRLRSLTIEQPTDLRDMAWAPAMLGLATGADVVALLPSRYPGTEAADDSACLLARKTVWIERDGTFLGLGQRILATDHAEYPLLDIREVRFEPTASDG